MDLAHLQIHSNRMALRGVAVLFFSSSTIFWLLCALRSHPWIVTADHDSGAVARAEQLAAAQMGLAILAFAATWLPSGLLGRGRLLLATSVILALGWLTAGIILCGHLQWSEAPYQAIVYLLGLILLMWGTACTFRFHGTIDASSASKTG